MGGARRDGRPSRPALRIRTGRRGHGLAGAAGARRWNPPALHRAAGRRGARGRRGGGERAYLGFLRGAAQGASSPPRLEGAGGAAITTADFGGAGVFAGVSATVICASSSAAKSSSLPLDDSLISPRARAGASGAQFLERLEWHNYGNRGIRAEGTPTVSSVVSSRTRGTGIATAHQRARPCPPSACSSSARVALAAAGADARALLRIPTRSPRTPRISPAGRARSSSPGARTTSTTPPPWTRWARRSRSCARTRRANRRRWYEAFAKARARGTRENAPATRDAPGRPGRVTSDVTSFLKVLFAPPRSAVRVSVFFGFGSVFPDDDARNAREKSRREDGRRSRTRAEAGWLSGRFVSRARVSNRSPPIRSSRVFFFSVRAPDGGRRAVRARRRERRRDPERACGAVGFCPAPEVGRSRRRPRCARR